MSLLTKEQSQILDGVKAMIADYDYKTDQIRGLFDLVSIIDDLQARAPNSLAEEQVKIAEKRPKMRSEEFETPKSRAVFYSILWPSMRKAAMDLGWALALHGSLENDMDIMGMPWTENCKSHQELAKAISDCLGDTIWREHHLTPHYTKPHGRVVYTLSIGGSWHVDLSIMPQHQLIRKQYTEQELNAVFESMPIADLFPPIQEEHIIGKVAWHSWKVCARFLGALKEEP